jgi:D-sedoheptulose 7-phosphate isomerase
LDTRWEKHGVEISEYAAKQAEQFATIFCGELEHAGYQPASFDVIVAHHVIEHLFDPIAFIQQVRTLLKPGGHLLLATPDFDSGCARRFGGNYRLLHDPTHVSLFSNESMFRFLRDHGFVVDRVHYPFFETRHFTRENLLRLFDVSAVSPPFYGNYMSFYCRKPNSSAVSDALQELSRLAEQVAQSTSASIEAAGLLIAGCLKRGNKVLACGNGGSAADAQHFVAELVGRMSCERQPLPAISLSSDPSIVTALGNDYGYENLFARQVEGLGQPGDVLVAISTSGSSKNVVRAIRVARDKGMKIVALVGKGGHQELLESDFCLRVSSDSTQRIQEIHTAILHALCEAVDRRFTE